MKKRLINIGEILISLGLIPLWFIKFFHGVGHLPSQSDPNTIVQVDFYHSMYENVNTDVCGIDKHALIKGKDAVRKELEYRLAPNLLGGGTVFGLDHRIPNGVHIDTYRYYVNLGREMLGLEPISAEGWARMAF